MMKLKMMVLAIGLMAGAALWLAALDLLLDVMNLAV